jgi:hypothetical protein
MYPSDEIIAYAVKMLRENKLDRSNFDEMIRNKFPGITDLNIRKAMADAKLLLTLKELMEREEE